MQMEFSVFLKGLGALCWEHTEDKRSLQNLHWAFNHGHFALVTLLKDLHQQMDLQVKSFKHLDCISEQLFFGFRDTFCICAATGSDQTRESTQVSL